jgi:hypothetical protein
MGLHIESNVKRRRAPRYLRARFTEYISFKHVSLAELHFPIRRNLADISPAPQM